MFLLDRQHSLRHPKDGGADDPLLRASLRLRVIRLLACNVCLFGLPDRRGSFHARNIVYLLT